MHPDKCSHPHAAHAFELITAARGVMAPAAPDDDGAEIRDDVVRVDANGEVVVGARGDDTHDAARDFGDIEDIAGVENTHTTPAKGFARAAAEHAASHLESPLQLRTRLPAMSTNRVRHELVAWSLPADMIPESLKLRAPAVDFDCYLAVEVRPWAFPESRHTACPYTADTFRSQPQCTSVAAVAAAKRATENAGCEGTCCISQIQAHFLRTLFECTTCDVCSIASTRDVCSNASTSNIYQYWQFLQIHHKCTVRPDYYDCLLISITKYTHTADSRLTFYFLHRSHRVFHSRAVPRRDVCQVPLARHVLPDQRGFFGRGDRGCSYDGLDAAAGVSANRERFPRIKVRIGPFPNPASVCSHTD